MTIGDIFDYNLSWDFEEREEGRQYPGIRRKRFFKNRNFRYFLKIQGRYYLRVVFVRVPNLERLKVFNYILRHEFETAKTELDDDLE